MRERDDASGPTIRFVCQPADDATFAAEVAALAERLGPDATGRDLQSALRVRYPHAIVVPTGRLAPLGAAATRWVYRDGTHERSEAAGA